jgi:hypothetical protein
MLPGFGPGYGADAGAAAGAPAWGGSAAMLGACADAVNAAPASRMAPSSADLAMMDMFDLSVVRRRAGNGLLASFDLVENVCGGKLIYILA